MGGRVLRVGAGGYAHIDHAVAAALEGDTILIAPGNYLETIRVHGKSIDIRGIGDRASVVVGWPDGRGAELVDTTTTLANLTLVGGFMDAPHPVVDAAVLVLGGAPRMWDLTILDGWGLVFGEGARGSLISSQITSAHVGIALDSGASPLIEECVIANCRVGVLISGQGTSPALIRNRAIGCVADLVVRSGAQPVLRSNDFNPANPSAC